MNQLDEVIKICFIAPKAYPLFDPNVGEIFGGAEVDLYFLATELAKDDKFEVSFITADYNQRETETIEGVKIIKSLDFKKNKLNGAVKIWKALRKADADMYMIKTISLGVYLVYLFCRLHRKIFLYRTAHKTHCDGTYLKKHPVRGKLFRRAIRHASLVFVQNRTDYEGLRRTLDVDSIVIPNGHRLPPLSDRRREFILWVGRSADFKRPGLFIDLAEKMSDEKFTMICQQATGDDDYDALVARAGQIKNLEFIKRVPFGEIDNYFQRAKVFVNTSDAEGFPNTFIQACKSATPILSLNVNPDDFLRNYNCGVCCYNDTDKFQVALGQMLKNASYKELSRNARDYAKDKHDISEICDKYKELFINLKKDIINGAN